MKTEARVLSLGVAAALLSGCCACGGGSVVPVGTYLYANPANPEQFKGRLTVKFTTPGERMVIACGRKYRKDRKSRSGTTEANREVFKPHLAKMMNDGTAAVFWHLPVDKYDLVVVDAEQMKLYEGLALLRSSSPELAADKDLEGIKASLSPATERIGGWEGFFDTKQFERFETDGVRANVLLQQMRLGTALAESGAVLKGCIHSIDMCWVDRAKVEGAGWQVVCRQQLYRDELPSREFFTHTFLPELNGIRIGTSAKETGPIVLP